MKVVNVFAVLGFLIFSSFALAVPPPPDVPGFPDIGSNGNTYHVDNISGSDDPTTNDGSANFPWASFKFSAYQLLPGDKLIVHGTGMPYDMAWIYLVRTDNNTQWISIEGQDGPNGERATFTGRLSLGDTTGGSVAYIAVRNVLFEGEGGSNINIVIYPGSHHLAFDEVEIDCQSHPENSRALWTARNVRDVWFRNMFVHHCGYQRDTDENNTIVPTDCGGLCVKEESIDEVVFDNVTASDNVGDGMGGASAIRYGNFYFKQCISENNTGDGYDIGGTRVVFIDSISRNNGGHQGTGFKLWSKESWIVNSVSYNNDFAGLSIKPQHSGQNDAYILDSTFAMNDIGIYGGQISTHPSLPPNGELRLYVYNNIFHALNTSAIVINNINIQTIQEESNNYYFSDYDASLVPPPHWAYRDAVHIRDGLWNVVDGYSFAEMADGGRWSIESGQGAGDIGETDVGSGKPDPGFVALATGDLHLQFGSEAIDAGIDTGLIADIEGNQVTGNPDIGAYEYVDTDGDGILDNVDNCFNDSNPRQTDTDGDGIGNVCDPEQLIITSDGSMDGWVRESSETSDIGGSSSAIGAGNHPIRFGDDHHDRQYKAVVSFDTSLLPAGSTVQVAQLELTRGKFIGNNDPYTAFGAAWIDLSASGFGGNSALTRSDFEAQADVIRTGQLMDDGTLGTSNLDAAGQAAIEGSSRIQLRIAFELDDNDDGDNDYTGYYSGDNSDSGKHPRLVIEYTLAD